MGDTDKAAQYSEIWSVLYRFKKWTLTGAKGLPSTDTFISNFIQFEFNQYFLSSKAAVQLCWGLHAPWIQNNLKYCKNG